MLTVVLAAQWKSPWLQPSSARMTGSPMMSAESLRDTPSEPPSGPVMTPDTSTDTSPNGNAPPMPNTPPARLVVGTQSTMGKSATVDASMPATTLPPIVSECDALAL